MAYTPVEWAYRDVISSTKLGAMAANDDYLLEFAEDLERIAQDLGVVNRFGNLDTGWRSLTRHADWSAGSIHVRRVGRVVSLRCDALTRASGTGATAVVLPNGVRATASGSVLERGELHSAAATPVMYRTALVGGTDLTVYNAVNGTALYGSQVFLTSDAFNGSIGTAV